MRDIGGTLKAMADETQRIEREKHQRLVRAQEASVHSAMMIEQIRKQGEKQIELLTAIQGLLERMAPPAAPYEPVERPSLRESLAFVDK